MRAILLSLAFLLPTLQAGAQEYSISVGNVGPGPGIGVGGEPEPGIALEYRGAPFFVRGRTEIGLAAALELDTDRDLFVGTGLGLVHLLSAAWRFDASVLPGAYLRGDGKDLGSTGMFHTQIALSRRVGSGAWLGLALSHKSNAYLADDNPGEDALLLRYTRRF